MTLEGHDVTVGPQHGGPVASPAAAAEADPGQVAQAVRTLQAGGAVVLPTDTVYGLAAIPSRVDLLARLKGRPADMPIAVLVASLDQALALVAEPLPPATAELAARHWPGPLTLVLPNREAGGMAVGVRWPAHPLVVAIASQVGPIATTSANRHGQPTPATATEAAASLAAAPDLVLDGGALSAPPSTVVDLTGPEPKVLRAGALAPGALFGAG